MKPPGDATGMGDDALGSSATPPMRPAGAVLLSSSDLPV
jgi:hypothetical protein